MINQKDSFKDCKKKSILELDYKIPIEDWIERDIEIKVFDPFYVEFFNLIHKMDFYSPTHKMNFYKPTH